MMRVEPNCSVKRLSQAEPGELVRYRLSTRMVRALVVQLEVPGQDPRPGVVVLDHFEEQGFDAQLRAPWLEVAALGDDPAVLSFDRDYAFRFDPAAARVVPDEMLGRYPAGALLLGETGSALRVNPPHRGAGLGLMDVDLATGQLAGRGAMGRQVAVLDWEIRLGRAHDTPLFLAFRTG